MKHTISILWNVTLSYMKLEQQHNILVSVCKKTILNPNSIDEMLTSLGFEQTCYLHLSETREIPHFAKYQHLRCTKSAG